MADEILSQDEVDALLKGVLGDTEEEAAEAYNTQARSYFGDHAHINSIGGKSE